jgi:RNA polymerase sigma-70 factor, ECF subfamily
MGSMPASIGESCVAEGSAQDATVYDALFRAFAPGLAAFLARYVESPATAEDLVQDLFCRLWAERARMRIERGSPSVRTYLFTAARNRALNHLRRERVADRHAETVGRWLDPTDPSAPGEAALLASIEAERTIAALPPQCRRVFWLCRRQHLSHRQIAERLGISVKTVEVQMGRALKRLRAAQHRDSLTPLSGNAP